MNFPKVTQSGVRIRDAKSLSNYFVSEYGIAVPPTDEILLSTLCVEYNVVNYIPQELPQKTPEEIEADKLALIRAISDSCREYVESRANSSLIIQLTLNAEGANPNQMAIDVLRWGSDIYFDAENRKAQVMAGVADDYATLCDFSSHGEKPYTVYQLYLAEIVKNYSAGA